MKKRVFSMLISGILLIATIGHAAAYTHPAAAPPRIEGLIEPEIYQMVEDYKNGTFIQRNESAALEPEDIFSAFGVDKISKDDFDVDYIYDIKKIGDDSYAATRIAMVSLEKEDQGTSNGVVMFTRITYEEKYFNGNPWSYVKLTKVGGGVVQNNGNIWCEALYLKYDNKGDAYDASGNRLGYRDTSVDYGGAVYAPTVGVKYVINGPNDYYFNMGTQFSNVVGYTKGTISRRLGNPLATLIVTSSIPNV